MTKVTIDLPNGTKIAVEGNPEEVAQAVNLMQNIRHYSKKRGRVAKKSSSGKKSKTVSGGTNDRIRKLISEDFFTNPKTLKEVTDGLATKGHTYPVTSISPALVRLVRRGELRRLKKNDQWTYVNL